MDRPDDVGPAWDAALAAGRPALLEFVTDPEVPPLPPHIRFEQAKGLSKALFKRDPAARDALRSLASLRPCERRYLELKIAGHSYREIQRICGGRSYTNVNKHLTRARTRLRQIESGA